jgi:hypothetical protein
VRRIYAGFYDATHAIITTSESIGHWTKLHRLLAQFSGPEASNRSPSSADSITAMPGFRYSVHTGGISFQAAGNVVASAALCLS